MKRILLTILVLILFSNTIYAQNEIQENNQEIAFIYINGANNNTPDMKKWFYNGIAKFHPILRHYMYDSAFIRKHLLEDSQYSIATTPQIFFWGDKSYLEISALHRNLNYTEIFSPKIAQMLRTFIAYCMHDAIWIQKDHNMKMIVEDLHEMIKDNMTHNRPVILLGYSAGTFITYEYLFHKMKYIEILDLISKDTETPEEILTYIQENPIGKTCIDAITNSKLAILTTEGTLASTEDINKFKNRYITLKENTCKYCMQDGAVKGIINYASPIPLFYSDLANPNFIESYLTKLVYENIVSKNMFLLTVNYADDPLGFPTTRNLTPSEFEQILNVKLTGNGFIYDKSDVKSPNTVFTSHTSYWDTSKKFAKTVVDAYQEGFTYFNVVDKLMQQ